MYEKEVDDVNHGIYFKITDSETKVVVIFQNVYLEDFESEDDFSNQCKLFDDTFAFSCKSLNNLDKGELVVDNTEKLDKGLVKLLEPKDLFDVLEKDKTVDVDNNYYGDKESPYKAIKIINNLNLNFNRGNVLKYILRAGKKNEDKEIEDLIKAKNYIDYEIERLKIMNEH